VTPSGDEIVEYLASCFDGVYRALGESAPHMTNDAYVVRTYEMGRAFAEVALAMRASLGDAPAKPLTIIDAVLRHALVNDETGAMTLYAMAMVVGPRLLVSLRDAHEVVGDQSVRDLFDRAADVTVREIRSVGEVAKSQPPIDDPNWQEAARDLTNTLESAGNAESFGFSR
jgi:hypothetical protein